ncbi:hypothetical protein KPATCC21470_1980 [Kitasatospora purpeofusca]
MLLEDCSPRMRGWSLSGVAVIKPEALLPAHAGLVPATSRPPTRTGPAPRACGVGPPYLPTALPVDDCSPRMRGWSPAVALVRGADFLLPAHAGLVPSPSSSRRSRRTAPRACGVGPSARPPARPR